MTSRSVQEETRLSKLTDDVLGLIYASCGEDMESMKAFRHTCAALKRSPSVNAQIRSIDLSKDYGNQPSKVAAFPRNAVMKAMKLRTADLMPGGWMYQLEPAVRAKMSHVEELTLVNVKNSFLDEGAASMLLSLLPRLRALSLEADCFVSGSCKDLKAGGSFTSGFLNALAAQVKLRSLVVNDSVSFEALKEVAVEKLESLHKLVCYFPGDDANTAVNFFECPPLPQLQELILQNCSPLNLDFLLLRSPLLYLHLGESCDLPPGNYASQTLQSITIIPLLSSGFLGLAIENFPRLEACWLKGVDLAGSDDLPDADVVIEARNLATAAVKWPLRAVDDGKEYDGTSFYVAGSHRWSASLCASVLSVLHPLQPFISTVEVVGLSRFCFDNLTGFASLCEVLRGPFDTPRYLWFSDDVFPEQFEISPLLEAVPTLSNLIFVCLGHPPRDLLAAMLAEQSAGRTRSLFMELQDAAFDIRAKFQVVIEQWQSLCRTLPQPVHVTLAIN
ncbi:hypothetical protein DUNSADRAFT_8791 [Dunaliella salina]|uniref:Uncharacterized protein n=1 Tax=Dunaliella salina TaxID=3046 RepID=A0ABQ7GIQ6_DUNSA|nr:hypothetical protein DUNSADRAFT_8791 [Dunaliella salina]|eukprot:KAF5834498.1 hypothetical protein DUNSADRAFT_8791 [Dunaliella salina]